MDKLDVIDQENDTIRREIKNSHFTHPWSPQLINAILEVYLYKIVQSQIRTKIEKINQIQNELENKRHTLDTTSPLSLIERIKNNKLKNQKGNKATQSSKIIF